MASIESVKGSNAIPPLNGPQPGIVAATRSEAPATAPSGNAVSGVTPVGNASPADRQVQAAELQQSANKVQQLLTKAAPNLTFSVDQDSGRTIIKIVDPATNEVLRQIPAEEILRMDKNIDQMIQRYKGLLIDRQG